MSKIKIMKTRHPIISEHDSIVVNIFEKIKKEVIDNSLKI